MRREVEALLFATDQPLSLAKLASFFPESQRSGVREAIESLREEYERNGNAFTVVEFGGGYSISTRPEHAKLVRKLFRGRRKARLSKAALECLAIVAYKQPVTRLEMEEIRGVSVSGVIGTLLERDLVQIVGRADTLGHPLLYGTTRAFLDYLGLQRIEELPQLSELEDLLARKEELKQLAAQVGEEVSDEELDAARPLEDEDEEEEEEPDAPEAGTEPAPDDDPAEESEEDVVAPRAEAADGGPA